MKTSMLLLITCALFALQGNTQISVGGLKGKMTDKTKKKSSEPASKSQTSSNQYYEEETQFDRQLLQISSVANSLLNNRSSTKYYHLKENDKIGKVKYDSIREIYLKREKPTAQCLRYIREIDTFYTIYPKRLKTLVMDESIEKMKELSINTKDVRLKPDFLTRIANDEFVLINPKNMIEHITDYQEGLRKALMFMPEDADIREILNKTEAIKVDYTEYEKSGDYEKDVATLYEMRLDKVRCPKAVNTNVNLVAVVKQSFATSAEKFLRASITSSDWKVNKNGYGNVNDRTMVVYVVYTTPNGKCLLEEGELYCRYVGGKWENAQFHFIGAESKEMLSKNAQK